MSQRMGVTPQYSPRIQFIPIRSLLYMVEVAQWNPGHWQAPSDVFVIFGTLGPMFNNIIISQMTCPVAIPIKGKHFVWGHFVDNFLVWHLNHWGRVTHICVSKLTIIGLSSVRRQVIIWTNVWILSIRQIRNKLKWNLTRNLHIFIQENAFENIVWKTAAIRI